VSGFILDCSVAMAWHFEDEFDEFADQVLQRLKKQDAVVPPLFYLETANAALIGERRRGITPEKTAAFLSSIRSLPIRRDRSDDDTIMEEVIALARAQGLTVYDATYLELARRTGLPIATRDLQLRRAAERMNVPLIHIEAL
jgi:predicted nucleic acid-binding protein